MTVAAAVLIVAKAPVPGLAKTRLAVRYGPEGAAGLAAAALLDTIRTARHVPDASVIVAHTGDLEASVRSDEIAEALSGCILVPQRGRRFAERLMNAHLDAAALGAERVVQIGMDTPQVRTDQLADALTLLDPGQPRCALGEALDGGWWALATTGARGARYLADVPMSDPDTARLTRRALEQAGLTVCELERLADVDEPGEVDPVARLCPPQSEFARTADLLSAVTP